MTRPLTDLELGEIRERERSCYLYTGGSPYEDVRALLAHLSAHSQWVAVSERLPPKDTLVMVLDADGIPHIDEWIDYREAPLSFSSATIVTGEGFRNWDDGDITHWKPIGPLPAPPVTAEKGEV